MFEYLNDIDFLQALDKQNLRTHYVKIILLSFDEKPIKEIQGTITSGTLTVNGSSSVRRTISLSMLASFENSNIEDIDNEISINKKVKIFVGLKNTMKSYSHYGDIIWFPCGLFILSSATISRSTSGWSISINGKDKMCLLDGTVGGMLPASTTFHESLVELDNGDIEVQYPTIYHIIYEAVNHWGGEPIENIIISDLDETVKMLVRYMGDRPIYFSEDYRSMSFQESDDFPYMYSYGKDAGYQETDFTYPGELILNAGDTVVTLLDKITNVLSNYEYYYDIDGKFIFQQIKNYLNTGSPLTELEMDDYVKSYNNAKFLYSLTDLDTTTAITRSPKYDNLKNDFYAWGNRKTSSGIEVAIRYHLAIDAKPDLDMALCHMYKVSDYNTNFIIRYDFVSSEEFDEYQKKYQEADKIVGDLEGFKETWRLYQSWIANNQKPEEFKDSFIEVIEREFKVNWNNYKDLNKQEFNEAIKKLAEGFQKIELISVPCNEWREELYRRALNAQVTNSVYDNYYDSELIAEWRGIYDPVKWGDAEYLEGYNESTKKPIYKPTSGWNPDVFENPDKINFWLDFIDTAAEIGKYSINQIGRRTKVVSNNDIRSVYNNPAPDIIFIEGFDQDLIVQYQNIGQRYFVLTKQNYDMFSISTTGASCFDKIREMMYQNLSYNTTISITCLPKYYIEPNNIIYIEDKESRISGNYQITQYSLPLTYNGTMSITATEVLTRV